VSVTVLLGGPGAGKGTQAVGLARRLGVPHIASGDLFRAAVRDGTPVGIEAKAYMERGELVPDATTVRMLLARLAEPDAADGAVLDGFPRDRAQAVVLDAALAEHGTRVDLAISIEVPSDELVRRLSGRWVCRDAGHVYNETAHPPKVAGRCDIDDSELIQRADDKPETIQARLDLQLSSLRDVIDHYRSTGVLRQVDGVGSIDDVTDAVLAAVRGPQGA
jgi:adenylate kinase